jgi:tetratricopeptide (TPR) repeat protein
MTRNTSKKSHWVDLLQDLPLTRTEEEVVKRFAQDPGGRGFLPVADVLRSHKLFEESVELLQLGVQHHPQFAVARVVLAREYFQRGLLIECWRLLQESPVALHDNVLAQKLLFKLSLAFGDEQRVMESLTLLKQEQGIDAEIKRLVERIDRLGIAEARNLWRQDLSDLGIHFNWSDLAADATDSLHSHGDDQRSRERATKSQRFVLDFDLDTQTKSVMKQFHVVPLSEIFSGEHQSGAPSQRSPLELDSTTLAEIYVKQGHYAKALEIYRRLLRLAPHNDLLRMKVSEVARLDKEQRQDDLETDPVVYDRMEVVEIIDRQMRYYRHLLDKLS